MNFFKIAGKLNSEILRFAYVCGILVLGFIYFLRNKGYSVDDSFITYRYAYHLKEGFGLVFNIGESYYGTTAAGYAVLLAFVSWSADVLFAFLTSGTIAPTIQTISVAFSSFSIGAIAFCLPFIFAEKESTTKWVVCAAFCAYLFVGFPFNEVAGHETYTFIAVALIGTILNACARPFLSGLALAFAITLRPDAILFVPIFIILDYGRSQEGWRKYLGSRNFYFFILALVLIVVPWFIYLWIHFGQPLPGTMDAKRAQVALGYWPLYNLGNLFGYITDTVDLAALLVISFGFSAFIWVIFRSNIKSKLLQDVGYFTAVAWLLFGLGSATAYLIFNVTFWRWYGIPVFFALGITSLVGWSVILANFDVVSDQENLDSETASFVHMAPIIVISIVTIGSIGKLVSWSQSKNVNPHIYAYNEIADYLRRVEPDGTVIQMFEPGSFGFQLGPKFKVIDELGLISPGVAKALLRGDNNFAMRTFDPKYLVCSWKGNFSECSNQTLAQNYELIGEYNVDFWKPQIGTGARLYRRRQANYLSSLIGVVNPAQATSMVVKNVVIGDKWGKVDRIAGTSEWFVHPGETTDTTFDIECSSTCTGNYWGHIADIPKDAGPEAGNVKVSFFDNNKRLLLTHIVTKESPIKSTYLETNSNVLKVIINNNGTPLYDWLVFGFEETKK